MRLKEPAPVRVNETVSDLISVPVAGSAKNGNK